MRGQQLCPVLACMYSCVCGDQAYDQYYMEEPGVLVCVAKPSTLPPRDVRKHCFSVRCRFLKYASGASFMENKAKEHDTHLLIGFARVVIFAWIRARRVSLCPWPCAIKCSSWARLPISVTAKPSRKHTRTRRRRHSAEMSSISSWFFSPPAFLSLRYHLRASCMHCIPCYYPDISIRLHVPVCVHPYHCRSKGEYCTYHIKSE